MKFADICILDDLCSCEELLSTKGRSIFSPLISQFRSLLHRECAARGHKVIFHHEWVRSLPALSLPALSQNSQSYKPQGQRRTPSALSPNDLNSKQNNAVSWVILDKLWPPTSQPSNIRLLNTHRVHRSSPEPQVHALDLDRLSIPTPRLHIIDDAVFSGQTVRHICKCVALGTPQVVVFCAVGRADTLRALGREAIEVVAQAEVPHNWDILHARDFLTFLPFAGRRFDALNADPLPRALSYPFWNRGECLSFNNWSREMQGFIREFPTLVVENIERALGRSPITRDLLELMTGAYIPVPSETFEAKEEMPLDSLVAALLSA